MSSEDKLHQATDGVRTPVTRRDFLKTAGMTGLALGATAGSAACLPPGGSDSGDTAAPAGGGEGRPIKVGFVSRSPARWRRSARPTRGASTSGRLTSRTASSAVTGRSIRSRSSSRTRSRTPTARPPSPATSSPTSAVDLMMFASTPPDTSCRFADQAEALEVPCISNDCPVVSRTTSDAARRPTRRSSGHTILLGASRTSPPTSSRCGTRSTPTRRSARCGATDADGIAWSDPKTGQPPMPRPAATHVHRQRPLQSGTDDFTPQDQQVQGGRRRHQ